LKIMKYHATGKFKRINVENFVMKYQGVMGIH